VPGYFRFFWYNPEQSTNEPNRLLSTYVHTAVKTHVLRPVHTPHDVVRQPDGIAVRQRTTSSVVVHCRPSSYVVVRRRTANHMHSYVNDMQI